MKIILLKDVKGVGQRFAELEVSSGYAANFLLPQKLAVPFSKQNLESIKQLKSKSEAKREEENKRLQEKEAEREAKRLALEQFRQSQK